MVKTVGKKCILFDSKVTLPDDHIHDEAVAQQADHKHHRVDRSDDGDDGRHALLLPAIIVGHIAAVRVSGHPSWRIHRTVIQQRGEALGVFFENLNRSALHVDTCLSGWKWDFKADTRGGGGNAHMGISEGSTVASSQKYARENSFFNPDQNEKYSPSPYCKTMTAL